MVIILSTDPYVLGAYVYVTTLDGTVTTKTAKITIGGYYYFDGSMWQPIDYIPEYLYLSSFNLPMPTISTGLTYDLYNNVYKAQFTKAGNPTFVSSNPSLVQMPVIYNANQLDFVVTYYDNTVINVNSISTAGVLNYDVLSNRLGPSSFIDVVFVTKR